MARKKQEEEGAPAWMVTYGDMMTLLLCFFVIIVALSEIKEEEKYRIIIKSIKETFGYRGGVGTNPSEIPPEVAPTMRQLATAADNYKLHKGEAVDPGQTGRDTIVQQVREGQQHTQGGVARFAHGSAELPAESRSALLEIAETIRDLNNKVEVRGHTARADLPPGSPYENHMALSIARAEAVRDFLIRQGRIRPERLRVVGAGPYEPLVAPAYTPDQWRQNDRVEVISLEVFVREFEGGPSESPDENEAQQLQAPPAQADEVQRDAVAPIEE